MQLWNPNSSLVFSQAWRTESLRVSCKINKDPVKHHCITIESPKKRPSPPSLMLTACALRQLAALRQYLEERGGRAEKLEGWSVKTEAFYGPFADQLMRNDSQVTTRKPSCRCIQPLLKRPDQPIPMDHHHHHQENIFLYCCLLLATARPQA